MKTVRKFLFETDFDAADNAAAQGLARKAKGEPAPVIDAAPPPPPPPPPEPTFSEAELTEARSTAHAKGLKEGIAKGRTDAQAQVEAQIAASLTTINNQVAVMKAELSMDRAAILGEAATLALAMTRKMLPEFTRRGGLSEIEAVIERCLVDLRREPRLTARVPAGLLPELETKIASLAAAKGFEGRVNLIADETMAGASCRVEWADGGLERHGETIWQQVSMAFDRCLKLQGITPAATDHPETVPQEQAVTASREVSQEISQEGSGAQTAGEDNVGSDQATD